MPSAPRRVLVVDDTHDTADSLAELLRLHGYDAAIAYNGLQALAVFDLLFPAAVLLDLRMPLLDGYETARRLRGKPSGRSTFLIAVSAEPKQQAERRALASGFDAFLQKPASLDAMLALLSARFVASGP